MFLKSISRIFIAVSLLASSSTFASPITSSLSGTLHVDNYFSAYLSTDDNIQGSLLGSGSNWGFGYGIGNTMLTEGQDYFLHVASSDSGWIAGFLGEFLLSGESHEFANKQNFITTNTTDWLVSTTGWSNYTTVTDLGANGSWPWGYQGDTDSSAHWIWSSDAYNDNNVFFTLEINATKVPEPSILALMGLGIFALGFSRRKMKR